MCTHAESISLRERVDELFLNMQGKHVAVDDHVRLWVLRISVANLTGVNHYGLTCMETDH